MLMSSLMSYEFLNAEPHFLGLVFLWLRLCYTEICSDVLYSFIDSVSFYWLIGKAQLHMHGCRLL